MFTARNILRSGLTRLQIKPGYKCQASSRDPACHLLILKRNHCLGWGNGCNRIQPEAPPPAGPPSNNRKKWILGILLTGGLPFLAYNWGPLGPLLKLKENVETAVETAELVVDAVEKVAEVVEKVAEEITDDLPDGGGLQKAVTFVGDVAEETAKHAHSAGEFIDKVQEVQEKVDSFFETAGGDSNETREEANEAK